MSNITDNFRSETKNFDKKFSNVDAEDYFSTGFNHNKHGNPGIQSNTISPRFFYTDDVAKESFGPREINSLTATANFSKSSGNGSFLNSLPNQSSAANLHSQNLNLTHSKKIPASPRSILSMGSEGGHNNSLRSNSKDPKKSDSMSAFTWSLKNPNLLHDESNQYIGGERAGPHSNS